MLPDLPKKVWDSFRFHPALVCYRGSHAHGTYIPNSDPDSIDDIDIFAIEIPPLKYYLGTRIDSRWNMKGRDYWVDEWDIVEYSLRKYVGLLAKGNPNWCMTLWLEDDCYFHVTPTAEALIENREIFLGKKPIYDAFIGYARSQLKRMTAFQKYEGYMGAKRKALVDKFGYDVKNASHLIRLLRTLRDFLVEGRFIVNRKGRDATILIEIKTGRWHILEVKEEAERLFIELEDLYRVCDLPLLPDRDAIDDLLCELLWHYYGER